MVKPLSHDKYGFAREKGLMSESAKAQKKEGEVGGERESGKYEPYDDYERCPGLPEAGPIVLLHLNLHKSISTNGKDRVD